MIKTSCLFFAVKIAAVKDHKFAVGAVEGKIRVLATAMRLSDHWSAALWAKHSGPPETFGFDNFLCSRNNIGCFI